MSGYEIIWRNVKFLDPERIGLRFTSLDEGDVFRIYLQTPRKLRKPGEIADSTKKPKTVAGTADEWGCIWDSKQDTGEMGQPVGYPIVDWERDFSGYVVPNPYESGRFDGLEDALRRAEKEEKWVQLNSPYFIFERLHFLRGFENTMTDFYLYRENIENLIDKLADYQMGIIRQAAELGKGKIHCFDTTDDWGTQTGMMISPALWRQIFKPRYKKMIDAIHDAGMVIRFHTDGKVNAIVEDLIELGVDILNVHQPRLLGIDELAKYAGRICFEVSVDIQATLPTGDKTLIENEIREIVGKLATPHGGLIGVEYRYLQAIGATEESLRFAYECFKRYASRS